MSRVVWLSLTLILLCLATISLVPTYQIVTIDIQGEHPEMVAGEIAFPLILYALAYWSWTKARAADKQKEKKK